MFYRKISKIIEEYFESDDGRILCIDGARQIGKSFIVRELSKKRFPNYIELNMADDFAGERRFSNIRSKDDFYLQVSISDGNKLGSKDDTIIFIDEIQIYPELLTLLKSLSLDGRYRYICSGSELGLAMSKTTLIPMGSIREVKMYPMDFEEFLLANSVSETAIGHMRDCFLERKMLDEATHQNILYLFKCYLFVGGLVEVREHHIRDRERLFVLVAARHAEELAEMLERLLALDFALRERGVLKVQRRVLYDVDVAAGARGDRAQEVARDDDVRRSAADSLRRRPRPCDAKSRSAERG